MNSTGRMSGCRSDGSSFTYLTTNHFTSLLCFLVIAVPVCIGATNPVKAATLSEIQEQTGYTLLETVLGSSIPTGNGVPISQVEASGVFPPVYFPDTNYVDFQAGSDPFSQNINFTDASGGQSNGISGHAYLNVGQFYYGNTFSFAPGANEVTIHETFDWLQNVLNSPTFSGNGNAPDAHPFRVEAYAWVHSQGDNANTLARFDYLIDNNNMTAVAGVIPGNYPLLGSSLNSISVGVTESGNPTTTTGSEYFPGRNKPDIVAPGKLASETTAIVASAATMLYESAAGTDAYKSETMKAILLAGATKDTLPSWNQTSTVPLDDEYGAGLLNVYNSYVIQDGGQYPGSTSLPSTPVGIDGWDYGIATAGTSQFYTFEVPSGSTAAELSIALTWNAEVTDSPGPGWVPDVSLDNLDLFLRNSNNSIIALSNSGATGSDENNVEHIYLTDLEAGTYTLELANMTSGGSRDFGLAWRMETLFDVENADFNSDGIVDGNDFLAWQRNFGKFADVSLQHGDADGDADVDYDDYLILEAQFGTSSTLSFSAASATIPEPGTFGLISVGLFTLCQFYRLLGRQDS